MKWYELTINTSRRPDYPEDNTLLVKADSMAEAIDLYKSNLHSLLIRGDVTKCREVFYVRDFKTEAP